MIFFTIVYKADTHNKILCCATTMLYYLVKIYSSLNFCRFDYYDAANILIYFIMQVFCNKMFEINSIVVSCHKQMRL